MGDCQTIEELRAALQNEHKFRLRAEADNHAKDELLAMVAHELKTPLSQIVSLAGLLALASSRNERLSYTKALEASADSLTAILNDILDQAKRQAGDPCVSAELIDLNSFTESVSAGAEAAAHLKGLTFEADINGDLSDKVLTDPLRLKQILTNLIDNAIKHTVRGAVRLKIQTVGQSTTHVLHRFEVHDSGPGLSDADQAVLFQPFARGEQDGSQSQTCDGTGLGLYISARLVGALGGSLHCASVAGEGSVFWFTLPMALAHNENSDILNITSHHLKNTPPQIFRSVKEPCHRLLEGHVLVVDDNSINQMIVQSFLDRLGITSTCVSCGEEALQAVSTGGFDAVLLDLTMPGMDGLETARQIRSGSSEHSLVPIFALTAHTAKAQVKACRSAGMDGFIVKPVEVKALYRELSRVLPEKASHIDAIGA